MVSRGTYTFLCPRKRLGTWNNPKSRAETVMKICGVNPGEGNGGGPGPPSGEQDKQLISSRGGGNTLMEQPGRLEDESSVTTKDPSCTEYAVL
jgi:hypothetical protein